MKKKIIIGIVLAVIIGIVGCFIIKKNKEGKREYTLAEVKEYNYFVIKEKEKFGVIDNKGNILIEPQYSEVIIPNPEKDLFICYQDNQPTVYNSKKEKLFKNYDKVEAIRLKDIVSDLMYEKTVLAYTKNNKVGLINFEGKKITDNKYESIEALPDQEGKLLVKQEGKIGIININGYNLVKCNYNQIQGDKYYRDDIKYEQEGYIVSNTTKEGYRYGYIKSNGEKIIEPVCNELSRVLEVDDKQTVYLILAVNGKYGVYKDKEEIIPNEYQSIMYEAGNKVFVVEKTGKYGVLDMEGKTIIPLKYNQIDITGTCIYGEDESGTKVFDKEGKELNIDENTSILNTNNDKYRIEITSANGNILYGVIDNNGNTIIPQKYKYIEYLYENYFIASNQEGKLGVIDDNQNEKIELKYDQLQKIEETNIIQAATDEIKEFYSSQMEKICEIKPKVTIRDKEQYLYITNGDETKYIDIKNEKELQNTEVYEGNTLFAKKENNLWGFVDVNGNEKIECKYEKVTEFNKYGYAGIKIDGKWGVINNNGEIIQEPIYVIDEENEIELSFIGKYYEMEYTSGEKYYTSDIVEESE